MTGSGPGASAPAVRTARDEDLPELVRLLADDPLGALRERYVLPLPEAYLRAFEAIQADPNNELVVLDQDGTLVGMMQLTFIPYLTHQGRWRALVEGVRVDGSCRGQGLGRRMFEWAIERARLRGCAMVQLTTDKSRPAALGFYRGLGFVDSHEGMKLHL